MICIFYIQLLPFCISYSHLLIPLLKTGRMHWTRWPRCELQWWVVNAQSKMSCWQTNTFPVLVFTSIIVQKFLSLLDITCSIHLTLAFKYGSVLFLGVQFVAFIKMAMFMQVHNSPPCVHVQSMASHTILLGKKNVSSPSHSMGEDDITLATVVN